MRVITSSTPTSSIQKSIAASSFPSMMLLPDDRDDDAVVVTQLLAQLERRADVADVRCPTTAADRAAAPRCGGRTMRVGLGVAGVHRELDQVDAGPDDPLELQRDAPAAGRTCCRWCSSRSARPSPWRTRSCPPSAGAASARRRRCSASRRRRGRTRRPSSPTASTGNQVAVVLVVELADLGVAVGVRALRAAEVARVDDRDHDHQRKLFRPRPQPVGLRRHPYLVFLWAAIASRTTAITSSASVSVIFGREAAKRPI